VRVLDLFCKAGGATRGYQLAFPDARVVGVDIEPQANYVGAEFIQADALTFPLDGFDLIHASPPCHDHSNVTGRNRKSEGVKGTGWMLEATIRRLHHHGTPWVVENVEGARDQMPATFRLCGSSFGLNVRRHRLFASSFLVFGVPPCDHGWQTPRFRSLDSRQTSPSSVVPVYGHLNYPGELELRREAMGIDWMTNAELTQAIPPAYTEWIGLQFAALGDRCEQVAA
jgi:DNA (cytosine-5)-methyltransferase 1